MSRKTEISFYLEVPLEVAILNNHHFGNKKQHRLSPFLMFCKLKRKFNQK